MWHEALIARYNSTSLEVISLLSSFGGIIGFPLGS